MGFGTLPIYVAQVKGYLADNGLNATLRPLTSSVTLIPGLGRQYDIIDTPPADVFNAAAKGINIVAIAGNQQNSVSSPNSVLITKEASIKSVKDLAGKRVGLTSLTGGFYTSLLYLLKNAGVSAKSVTFVTMPYPTMADQLNAGRVDAAISSTPYWSPLVKQGFHVVLDVNEAANGQGSPNNLWASTRTFVDAHPSAITAFRKALSEADAYIAANPSAARQLVQSYLGVTAAVADSSPLPDLSTQLTAASLQQCLKVAISGGQVTGNVPDINSLILTGQ
jgi:NitT/TauT family transport system substrate-binding protein